MGFGRGKGAAIAGRHCVQSLLVLAAGLWAAGCASVTPPDGGERDTRAPQRISSTPADSALNFRGREITLVFDEPVTTDKLAEYLTITPATDLGTPRVTERDNTLTLQFQRPFAPNTTYFFDFGQALVDITERNKAENHLLVFSTGAILDSGGVTGKVAAHLNNAPLTQAIVGLFPVGEENARFTADSLSKHEPVYYTRTDATGAFKLRYVKAGRYRLFAYADANKNGRYDEPELIGYETEPRQLGDSASTTAMVSAIRLDTKAPILASRKEQPGVVLLQYNEGIRSIRVGADVGASSDFSVLRTGGNGRETTVFGAPSEKNQRLVVVATDSAGNQHIDSLRTRFGGESQSVGAVKAIKPTLTEGREEGQLNRWNLAFPVRVRALKPEIGFFRPELPTKTAAVTASKTAAKSGIKPSESVADSTQAPESGKKLPGPAAATGPVYGEPVKLLLGGNATLDSSASILTVQLAGASVIKSGVLQLDSTVLRARDLPERLISGRTIELKPAKVAEAVGSITVRPKTALVSFAIELLNEQGVVVQRHSHWQKTTASATTATKPPTIPATPATITWENLTPGSYRIRVLIDANGNGQWDGPDPMFTRLAEPVVFGAAPLVVRANWEQETVVSF